MAWRDRAACRHEDPELFFPVGTGVPAQLQTEAAKQVCRGCPVADECLHWALTMGQDSGVWGGTDPDERRLLHLAARREERRVRHRVHRG
ncbi:MULTISPECIES: WhiB family transcriptional regulator [Streptomycetaceae]|uniref:Transcriptional regulator WhiB n=1 Tax=Streptantibioticus cattleyicolor (strain ATCC 35852 / DSM 46488 / JCM 4925 / NBRC 14057 / NRRL 8057) TaxID=1003195 RepID=F8JNT3_STREN|nr:MULTISPECIES: WhiB family transcriptional regulator [Streptomycetaceae]AEW92662.1 regulatory protein [Streptantibioticus cattleyicolor NRRL 8057 = DSM 46488]MYS57435.1 WhiB family transcriptional regulator [Streptomyces sp. SID5468]CCB73018.1 conserved protein of unknown function [Streptantibioticus cattleyicolor NRRL 8057 = DSM 46488]